MSEQKKALTAKERQKQKETSEAAQKALEAQRQAHELTQAAAAAGDPNERQRLLNEALEKEVEAETFGKTARYLNTGAFQGLCAGAGLGSGIGISLGVITGTLVGGTTSVITGSLGGGIGLGVGAAHGPWFSVGEAMGNTLRKITGDIPGWKATDEQKAALDKMINGVKEQERPKEDELIQMSGDGGTVVAGKGYTGIRPADEEGEKGIMQGGKPSMPYVPGLTSKKKVAERKPNSKVQQAPQPTSKQANRMEAGYAAYAGEGVTSETTEQQKPNTTRRKSRPSNLDGEPPSTSGNPVPQSSSAPRRSSRIQQHSRSTPVSGGHVAVGEQKYSAPDSRPKKKPRKLEIRKVAEANGG